MGSPNPNQQYPYPGYTGQSASPYPDNRHSQAYPTHYSHQYPFQHSESPIYYAQPHYGTTEPAQFIAELPAPLPPAPLTSTPDQQLTEDERMAHRLQQLEFDDARKRSSTLSQLPSQYSLNSTAAPSPHPLLPSQVTRPYSQSVSATAHGPDSFGPAPTQPRSSLLPEVVVDSRPASFSGSSLGRQPTQYHTPVPHPTSHLPPAPTDPASLSAYLETHRQVPYPHQWVLPPVHFTFYASHKPAPKTDWLDTFERVEWRTTRYTERFLNPKPPSFAFSFKQKGGNFRDPRLQWTMTTGHKQDKVSKAKHPTWTYDLRMDSMTNMRKSERLEHAKGRDMLPTYVHAANYDSLRFIAPDGRAYKWVSHRPVTSVNSARHDTIRHALFVSTQQFQDPLFGQIVADHTFWDGFVDYNEAHLGITCTGCQASPIHGLRWICKVCRGDHNICEPCRLANNSVKPDCSFSLVNLPDEALYIRSSSVDPALVVATLQILKDWEKKTMKEERSRNLKGFEASLQLARRGDLGRISHWQWSDFEEKNAQNEVRGTVVKMREEGKLATDLGHGMGGLSELVGSTGGGDSGEGGGGSS